MNVTEMHLHLISIIGAYFRNFSFVLNINTFPGKQYLCAKCMHHTSNQLFFLT